MAKNPYAALEKAIGVRFRNRDLLAAALTHPSYRFEHAEVDGDNQRLEFLGDAVLDFLVAAHLYTTLTEEGEGVLTTSRSRVASGKALARLARSIDLGDYLRLGKGEEASGGRQRNSNLADALEAVLGAIYMDAGIKGAQKVFESLFIDVIHSVEGDAREENPKGKLQELAQRRWKANPVYRLLERTGPAHAALFTVDVEVDGKVLGAGTDSTKQKAECRAALEALHALEADATRRERD